jgi:hypothetical protein
MVNDAGGHDRPHQRTDPPLERAGGSGVVFALVTLALLLAIAFFYLTNDGRDDRPAEAVTRAAGSADTAARVVGDATRDAADDLREKR